MYGIGYSADARHHRAAHEGGAIGRIVRSIGMTLAAGTTAYCARQPSCDMAPSSWPRSCRRLVPSTCARPHRTARTDAVPCADRIALATRRYKEHHVIAGRDICDPRADLGDDAGALMAEHHGQRHRHRAIDHRQIRMTYAGRFHADQNFASARRRAGHLRQRGDSARAQPELCTSCPQGWRGLTYISIVQYLPIGLMGALRRYRLVRSD